MYRHSLKCSVSAHVPTGPLHAPTPTRAQPCSWVELDVDTQLDTGPALPLQLVLPIWTDIKREAPTAGALTPSREPKRIMWPDLMEVVRIDELRFIPDCENVSGILKVGPTDAHTP